MPKDARVTARPPETTDRFLNPAIAAPQAWDKLAAHLARHSMRLSTSPAPQQFSGGFGNLNFLVEIDGQPSVLRRPPAGPLPPGGNDMAREHKVLSRLWQKFPLAPRALHFSADDAVLGAPFFIMEYRPGWVVRGTLPEPLDGQGGALSAMLVETLAAFHAVGPAEVELDDLGRPEGFLERAVEGWLKRAAAATDDAPPVIVRSIGDWLRANRVPDPTPTLLHNDFKLDNVVLAALNIERIVAVLDWELSTLGEPLTDLGTTLAYWVEDGDGDDIKALPMGLTWLPGCLTRTALVDRWQEQSGRTAHNLIFYYVLAMFKVATIAQQIYARYVKGFTKDERFALLGFAAAIIGARAVRALDSDSVQP